MTLAFKEWSYIVTALGKGYQSIILRKGGISEEDGTFSLKGNKFLLLPTQFHQAKEMIKPEWLDKIGETTYSITAEEVEIKYFAEIVDAKLISDWSILKKLENQHAWKDEVIKERFNRWEKNVYLLIVQMYSLTTPFILPMKKEYEGCKSWINVDYNLDLEGSKIIYEKIKGTYF